ncbi:MAG: cupin domain-containing protein, partial [Planctomycetota bacterium]
IIRESELTFTPASHEDPDDPGCLKKVLASKLDLQEGRIQMLNWSKLPAGKSFQSHYHEDMQEVFVMVSGTAKMSVEQQSFVLLPGDCLIVDPQEVHSMTNETSEDTFYLVFGISNETGGKTVVVSTAN